MVDITYEAIYEGDKGAMEYIHPVDNVNLVFTKFHQCPDNFNALVDEYISSEYKIRQETGASQLPAGFVLSI